MEKKPFKVFEVPLESCNLVEASAGTGKTFSIAILSLRLILEKKIDLSQILMVTFTKAAVAELESRIRAFIKDAYNYVNKNSIDIDNAIKEIVDSAIKQSGKAFVKDRLKGAQFQLDETSIFTIHSFCQKVLTEFAFETNQLFTNDVKTNVNQITDKYIDAYWREKITCLPAKNLVHLKVAGLNKKDLHEIVKKGIGQGKFVYNCELDTSKHFELLDKKQEKRDKQLEYFIQYFKTSNEKNNIEGKLANNSFGHLTNDALGFFNQLIAKQKIGYVKKLFPALLEIVLKYQDLVTAYKETGQKTLKKIYGDAINIVQKKITQHKEQTSILVFDDLISNLHKAIKSEKSDLLKYELQKKYKAIFVDEFQDTDNLQYEIFDTLFGKSSIVFYIGDPKQAIYGFRGADIETYKSASKEISQIYTMKHNYRSTEPLIKAMNHFFNIENPFLDKLISYEEVERGKKREPLNLNNKTIAPLLLINCNKAETIIEQVSYRILNMLQSSIEIQNRALKPSDFSVLVRNKEQGSKIYNALRQLNIPAVTTDEILITETEEAQCIEYLLSAIINPKQAELKRILLSPITNYTKENLLNNTLEEEIQQFKMIHHVWLNKGVYSAINLFLKTFNSKEVIFEKQLRAERIYTNILQLQEILHKIETEEKLKPETLLTRLQSNNSLYEGDEYTQRIESEEDAVQITTIHKSKGLAYNIVFAPFLDLKVDPSKHNLLQYKNKNKESVFSIFSNEEEKELYLLQNQQENKRLIYVALTRAVYANIIFQSTGKSNSDLKPFLNTFENNPNAEILDILEKPNTIYSTNSKKITSPNKIFNRTIEKKWGNTSYSSLSNTHLIVEAKEKAISNKYDTFVFEQLGKGAQLGNFLHDIFENIDFRNDDNHLNIIGSLSRKYAQVYQQGLSNYYLQLIKNTLKGDYGNFSLTEISLQNRISELEFYFQISGNTADKINHLSPLFHIDKETINSGIMYGFVDLFFQHNGMYYILDWKSNFLGNQIEDYSDEKLDNVMIGNNYHLQYMLYTIALKRFLEQKISQFDYQKHFGGVYYAFVRGCRANKKSGIFFKKPDYELVNQLDHLL